MKTKQEKAFGMETYAPIFVNVETLNFSAIFLSPKLWIYNANLDVERTDLIRIAPLGDACGILILNESPCRIITFWCTFSCLAFISYYSYLYIATFRFRDVIVEKVCLLLCVKLLEFTLNVVGALWWRLWLWRCFV